MMKYCQPLLLIFFLANIVHKMMKDDGIMTILYKQTGTLAWQSTLGSPVVTASTYSCFTFLHT